MVQLRGMFRDGRRRLAAPCGSFRSRRARTEFGETEIQNLGLPLLGDKNIRRLDVAMDDALAMRRVQTLADLNGQVEQLLEFQRGFPRTRSRDHLPQRFTLQQFHYDEWILFVFFDFMNGANVGMVQRRCRTRFALKPMQGGRIARQFFGQEFQCDSAS